MDKKNRFSLKILAVCTLLLFLSHSPANSGDTDCVGGSWSLVESKTDIWGLPGEPTIKNPGRSLGFWLKPTSCVDTIYEEGRKVEYTKQLVCAPPTFIKIQTAPNVGSCTVNTENAIPEPQSTCGYTGNDPCFAHDWLGCLGGSQYGQVTIKNTMKVYEATCPSNPIFKSRNSGPGCGDGLRK